MLPEHIHLVLLSATVPNTFEFASWVGRTKRKNIHVIATPKRPVPLEHHLFLNGQKELFKIVNAEGEWQAEGHTKALAGLGKQKEVAQQKNAPRQQQQPFKRQQKGVTDNKRQYSSSGSGQNAHGNTVCSLYFKTVDKMKS